MAISTEDRPQLPGVWASSRAAAAEFLVSRWKLGLLFAGILFATGLIEWGMGRSVFGPDGKLGFWAGNVWTSECSQRLADPYSFSHVLHGVIFYALLWLVAGRLPVSYRLVGAVLLEAGWEVLENSPVIIQRYRELTIALGYDGDSILNSLSDILLMAAGFLFASWARVWSSVALFIGMEAACAWWVRDNLSLNVIMLLYPLESVKAWQSAIRPL